MPLSLAVRIQTFRSRVSDRFVDERGAVATEYVLVLILVAVIIIAGATAFGLALGNKYEAETCNAFSTSC